MSKFQEILSGEGLTKDQDAELVNLGWFVVNDGEYLDIQFEVMLLDESSAHCRLSMNVQFTIHHNDKSIFLIFGNNEGDGFNSFVDMSLSDLNLLSSFDKTFDELQKSNKANRHIRTSKALHLIKLYPESFEYIRKVAITELEKWLKVD